MQEIWRFVLVLVAATSLSGCILAAKYPIDIEQAAGLGFSKSEMLQLGGLVNVAYVIFNKQLEDKKNNPNPPFPSPFFSGFTPIVNLQAVDNIHRSTKEFYGHLSWLGPAQDGTLVISIRGTSDVQEWIDDAKFELVKYNDNKEFGRVELGFKEIVSSFTVSTPNEEGFTLLDNFMNGYKGKVKRIFVVGHSLGSSLATLVAFDADVSGYADQVQLLTFASPLTGDAKFVKVFQSRIKDSIRVVNKPDIVPRVPPPLFGYRHIWRELEIDSYPDKRINHSIVCYHSLLTYLYVLNGGTSELAKGCATGYQPEQDD